MIFTRDFVTRENHWQIASLVTPKSLFTVTHALFFISQRNESSLLNYALKLGRFDMVHYFLDQGIELSDASLSILLNSCSHRSNRFPINSTCVTSRQGLSDIHLRIQAVSRQLLSLRPQLINEKWDNILPTPILCDKKLLQVACCVKWCIWSSMVPAWRVWKNSHSAR